MAKKLKAGVLIISDRAFIGDRKDECGPCLSRWINRCGWVLEARTIVQDSVRDIEDVLKEWSDNLHLDLVVTSGGTGIGPKDVTPDATVNIVDKEIPGVCEELRRTGIRYTPYALLSRQATGVRGKTLIINLPGNPKSLTESFPVLEAVVLHAIEMIRGGGHHLKQKVTGSHGKLTVKASKK
ncbi:molybdenum cofactor biosynthesis protein B [Elusimicrobiota bacterium]